MGSSKNLKQKGSSSSSENKKKTSVVYAVAVQVSPYKEDPSEPEIHLFRHKNTATKFMRETAKEIYCSIVEEEESEEYDSEGSDSNESDSPRPPRTKTPPGAGRNGSYWYEDDSGISFGEDESMGQCYRRGWGTVTLHEKYVNEESENKKPYGFKHHVFHDKKKGVRTMRNTAKKVLCVREDIMIPAPEIAGCGHFGFEDEKGITASEEH